MQDKNAKSSKDPLAVSSDPELESRVDAMMALTPEKTAPELPERPSVSAPAKKENVAPKAGRRIDIFHDTKTAPEVPSDLAEVMSVETSTPDDTSPESVVTLDSAAPVESEAADPLRQPIGELADAQDVADAYDDAETDRAIDEITRSDADKALLHDDIVRGAPVVADHGEAGKKRRKRTQGGRRWLRYVLIVLVIVVIGGAGAWPTSRYFILNTAGVRSSASMKITDGTTGLPLKNATVRLGGVKQVSNGDGLVQFKELKLGSHQLTIERVAFAPIKRTVVLGWGSNPLGNQELNATGAQYVFNVRDYLSDKPVPLAEAVSQDAAAVIDEHGIITLTVEDPSSDTLEVRIAAPGYRTETITLSSDSKETTKVRMVPAKPIVYITKESGKYDVYKVDVDGNNKQLLLANIGGATARVDNGNGSLLLSEDGKQVAIVSKYGSTKKNANGVLLDSLTVVDIATAKAENLDYAEQMRLYAWNNDTVIYSAVYASDSEATAKGNQRIVAYDLGDRARTMLVTADSFSGIMRVREYLYYTFVQIEGGGGFARIRLDGKEQKTLLNEETWALRRTGGTTLDMNTGNGSRRYNLANGTLQEYDGTSGGRFYLDGTGDINLWVDERDGADMLLAYDMKTGQDTLIAKQPGMVAPVQWLNQRTVVVSVQIPAETALYAISLDGGEPVRITAATLSTLPNASF